MLFLIVGSTSAARAACAASLGPATRIDEIASAFPNGQTSGTRLVLTQSTYALQRLVDALQPDERLVLTSAREALARRAPEAFERRGPWHRFEIVDLGPDEPGDAATARGGAPRPSFVSLADQRVDDGAAVLLVEAYDADAADRRRLCDRAATRDPASPIVQLALASAAREQNDMRAARTALDSALASAPEWPAAHYEDGKFWLGYDETARARDAFARAGALMPTFAAAFSNLGSTLGELDEPEAALAAFRQALAADPHGPQVLSNIGVVTRELGRLDESAATLRRVVLEAPDFVFGHYNLGHTLFLAGDYAGAVSAYEEGQRRDSVKNRRQGCRLALARLAAGDAARAEREFWPHVNAAPADEREDLLLEAYEVVQALAASGLDAEPLLAAAERIRAALRV